MTYLKQKLCVLMMLMSFSVSAQFQIGLGQGDDVTLGHAGYGGTGCPAGSASVTLSPDAKSLSIIFDEFLTEAGRGVGKTIDRKSCNIAIPVHIPQGYSVSVIGVDYRGYVFLPNRSAMARFSAEYFLAGQIGPKFNKTFRGMEDTDYTISNDIGVEALIWSACGQDVNLRVNASMMLRNTGFDDALATVDSADFSSGIIYQLQWKKCGGGSNSSVESNTGHHSGSYGSDHQSGQSRRSGSSRPRPRPRYYY